MTTASRTGPSRRWMTLAALAAGLSPRSVSAQEPISRRPAGSILAPEVYQPPTNLQLVADLYQRMTTPVRVDGRGPFPFIVDTGANQSVLSLELAQELGLPIGPSEPLHGVAGVQAAPSAVASLALGERTHRDVHLSLLPAAAIGGPGMLGLDHLADQCVTLNFRARTLIIEDSRRTYRNPADRVLPATKRDGQLTLIDAFVAGVAVTAFVDSGAQSTIGNHALHDLALKRNPDAPTAGTMIVSVTGQSMTAEITNLPQLRVGGLSLPMWPVAFADLHTFELWRLIDRPAILLGVDILTRFEYVSLDFPRSEVRVRIPGEF
jgi:predicted aspartyl protease